MAYAGSETRRGVVRLGTAAAGLGLLGVLVGLGARSGAPAAGPPPATGLVVAFRVLLYLALAFDVAIGAVLVYALWPDLRRRRRRPEDEWEEYHEPPRLHWAFKAAAVAAPLVLLAGLIVVAVRTAHGGAAPPAAPPLGPGRLAPVVPVGTGQGGAGDSLVALAIAAGIMALAAAASSVLLRRRRSHLLRPAAPARAMVAAVDDGLEALRRERDPRRAVVLAYAAMERALGGRGWPRADAEAPLEYLARLAGRMPTAASALHALTELFEVARFSEHPVDEPMRTAAVRHLESVRTDLEAQPSTA